MYSDLVTFRMLLVALVFGLLILPYLDRRQDRHRELVTLFAAFMGFRYLIWRLFETVLPFDGPTIEVVWVYIVYIVEVLAFVEISIFLLIMSKTNSRHKEADLYQASQTEFPSVDVFIPTYNEEIDVLEKTIIGAKNLDYPDFKVWVLDDGKREWLKGFCKAHNVNYLTREDNSHAKAGNLNNGLKHASGELFAIFDADFVPLSDYLKRTTGFFVNNPDVGLVQTPQHFYNRDPIQSNLYLDKLLPDEQRLFFDVMAPCRDRWDAAFCCGSCSITRRKAVDEIGGIPTSSITEDLLTTLSLLKAGYKTIYLNEKLSHGMSADSLEGYFVQRSRWCRGGIQCLLLPEGPLRAKGLSPLQRILFAPYSWIIQPITKLMLLIVPIVYLLIGLSPLQLTTTQELISYQFPMFFAFTISMWWLARKRYIPIISTASNIFSMFRIFPVVVSSLIKPFGKPFMVTPKGSGAKVGVDWYIIVSSLILILLTITGVFINQVPELCIIEYTDFFPYALFWSTFNIIFLFMCILLAVDTPRKRKEERFRVNEITKFEGFTVVVSDVSVGGCRVIHSQKRRIIETGEMSEISIPGISEPFQVEVKNSSDHSVMLKFVDTPIPLREQLITKLFTGHYDNSIYETGNWSGIFWKLWNRAFGKEIT
ncbi:glycosyltransferase family 2 protein [Solemya velum gill symbiont]|uniref:glycosyltransferase family 2 protein n=1 Tax=Solemya velum gill symbiont TaxID=2340 RepID=UPI0009984D4D|nr:cellulose synthase catalytic subunit [Solemya velum gill symbiont]OOY49922.1 hypothetical protein BOV97_12145 [Solemya velum gill symbiont]OOY54277.1 hypothetical protein BOV99_11550 [Solemya velum gill symbiont]OOY54523.1 hypothetical protein BOW00_11555 [Solemya velum gill symbiont]OOY58949.1 hypothetical protein BOW02_11885 [Solemya velum gill symbiont]OOY60198.1 hypothetical protein BOW04_11505 [Solemya velum gill symbiont]